MPNSTLESLGCFRWVLREISRYFDFSQTFGKGSHPPSVPTLGLGMRLSVKGRAGDIGEKVVRNGSNRLGIRSRSSGPC